jgi:hypothetical protein
VFVKLYDKPPFFCGIEMYKNQPQKWVIGDGDWDASQATLLVPRSRRVLASLKRVAPVAKKRVAGPLKKQRKSF